MKTNLNSLFKTSVQPIWLDVSETTSFLVKPFSNSNPQIKAAYAAHYKPVAYKVEMGTLTSREETEVQAKFFVNACLVDWKGVEIDGVEVPFNKDKAIALFIELPELLTTLMKYAQDFKNYLSEGSEDLGN